MGLDAGLSSLDFFVVNFERFCGHVAEGEGPESSGEREFAAKRHEKAWESVILLRAERLRREVRVAGR